MSDLDDLLEQEFPVERNFRYLNHAAVAPWPLRTGNAVRAFAAQNVDMGARDYNDWVETEQGLRRRLAALVHAPSPDDIALTKNTSEALSMVAHGFPWNDGDNVVIAAEEFPSNRIVWESLAGRGVTTRPVTLTGVDDPETALLAAIDGRTRILAVSSVQYGLGLRVKLKKLGAACRARGVAFCVDAIQGLGVFDHNVQAANIDFLMADAHKWLLGPEGIAVFYCSAAWREKLTLHEYGWHMVEDLYDFERRAWRPARSARRFECGSPNMLGIHALSASLSLFEEIGLPVIEKRVLARAEYLFEIIKQYPDLELLSDPRPGRYAGIVTFRHRRHAVDKLYHALRGQNVVCVPRGGGIRFSPHCYTRIETLQEALEIANLS